MCYSTCTGRFKININFLPLNTTHTTCYSLSPQYLTKQIYQTESLDYKNRRQKSSLMSCKEVRIKRIGSKFDFDNYQTSDTSKEHMKVQQNFAIAYLAGLRNLVRYIQGMLYPIQHNMIAHHMGLYDCTLPYITAEYTLYNQVHSNEVLLYG